ncbi:hypothetical protein PoHVEF18_009818 [Penicillium ochrochloron]
MNYGKHSCPEPSMYFCQFNRERRDFRLCIAYTFQSTFISKFINVLLYASVERGSIYQHPTAIHKTKSLDSPVEVASPSGTPEPQQVVAYAHPSKPHVAELVVRQQAAAELKEPVSAEDERAMKLSRKDLQSYWRKEEQNWMVPRGELSVVVGVLQ